MAAIQALLACHKKIGQPDSDPVANLLQIPQWTNAKWGNSRLNLALLSVVSALTFIVHRLEKYNFPLIYFGNRQWFNIMFAMSPELKWNSNACYSFKLVLTCCSKCI